MPRLENERCPEGGPGLQVTGEGPRGQRAPRRRLSLSGTTARRPAAPSRGLRLGAPRLPGGKGCGPPTPGKTLTLPARPTAAVRCGFPPAACSGGTGKCSPRGGCLVKMEKFLQIAPHSLAIVLGPADSPAEEKPGTVQPSPPVPTQPRQLARHHIGYEIFADFKAENMQHFWNKKVTAAVAETFFLGWIDEQVLLIQGKEEHLEALREGWTRRALRPPSGFQIRCLGECHRPIGLRVPCPVPGSEFPGVL